jgi:hypothetical protein
LVHSIVERYEVLKPRRWTHETAITEQCKDAQYSLA